MADIGKRARGEDDKTSEDDGSREEAIDESVVAVDGAPDDREDGVHVLDEVVACGDSTDDKCKVGKEGSAVEVNDVAKPTVLPSGAGV